MPVRLRLKLKTSYVYAVFKGKREAGREVEELISNWSDVAALCEKSHLSKVLAVLDIQGKIPLESAYKMDEAFTRTRWKPDYKLAIVVKPETLSKNIILSEKLWENMGYTMKLFTGERAAKKWLLRERAA